MSGKYQAYSEYKDSGVEWLDVVPSHWNVSKVKHLAPFQVGWTPSTRNDENFIGENLWVNISDLKTRTIVDTAKKISDKAAKEASMDITPKGSLMYSFKLSVGAVSFAGKDLYTNEAIASFLATAKLPLNYLYYALPKFVIENASTNIYGAKILNQELINNALLLAPSFAEAEKIANFLDHETAKIDTLIEKQQQLIKLLKEKRQAVISHAVTKGLPSANGEAQAPMKDSSVEWLGEVPEHWVVKPLRFLGTCQNGINIGADFFGSGYPFVSYGDAYRNYSLPTRVSGLVRSTEKDREAYSLLRGDVLFTRTSETIEEIGLSSACLEFIPEATFAGFLIRFRPAELTLHPEFSKFSFRNQLIRAFFVKEMNLVTRASLSQELLKKLPVPCPPLEEQVKIAEFLCVQEERFQSLFDNAEKAVLLLKERRTALISAAVTGKIDVRNWQAPTSQNQALEQTA
ncbi:restriction endonuclease subunit S (plasmid) [Vibrio campbellii]|uniref:Restriction endonuclease subunit S n=1 Tax=Vibrio campbellii TaxID=680 RepID=A0AAQ2Y5K9_9VIBR|nr:restriction endonuclease subunit S [Vibrio campbellii]WDG12026.1 restriction endonuclease subunit S [Vibrio campbellii]